MLHFLNDYESLGHPNVLAALAKNWDNYYVGYGFDTASQELNEKVRTFTNLTQAETYVISGGTMTNLLACSAFLFPYESIIATDISHINTMEAAAVEATGHKILTCPNVKGKLTAENLETVFWQNQNETKAKPGLVFLANTSEAGTVYNKQELESIAEFCLEHDLLLFIDGARLGFALASANSDLTLADIARLADVFYIGGTKNGAVYGEALVITNPGLQENFCVAMKNRGALLAKGFATAIQFNALFSNEASLPTTEFAETLYMQNARQADKSAAALGRAFTDAGFELLHDVQANLVFVKLPLDLVQKLKEYATFEVHGYTGADKQTAICRFVCTYQTKAEDIMKLEEILKTLK